MKEADYINATNLAKVRAAKVILYDTLPMTPEEETAHQAAAAALNKLEALVAAKVKTT